MFSGLGSMFTRRDELSLSNADMYFSSRDSLDNLVLMRLGSFSLSNPCNSKMEDIINMMKLASREFRPLFRKEKKRMELRSYVL